MHRQNSQVCAVPTHRDTFSLFFRYRLLRVSKLGKTMSHIKAISPHFIDCRPTAFMALIKSSPSLRLTLSNLPLALSNNFPIIYFFMIAFPPWVTSEQVFGSLGESMVRSASSAALLEITIYVLWGQPQRLWPCAQCNYTCLLWGSELCHTAGGHVMWKKSSAMITVMKNISFCKW